MGYDPALFFCWEEYDFCLRAIARGWQVQYRGDLAIRHKVSAERRVAWSGNRWFHFVRNRLYIERKYGTSWLGLSPRIGGYIVKGLWNGLPLQTLRAIAHAVPMATRTPEQRLPPAARAYLRLHDHAHRESGFHRLRSEVFTRTGNAVTRAAFGS